MWKKDYRIVQCFCTLHNHWWPMLNNKTREYLKFCCQKELIELKVWFQGSAHLTPLAPPTPLTLTTTTTCTLTPKIANPCTPILETTSPCTLNLMITKLYTLNLCNYKFMQLNFDNCKPLHLDSFKCRPNFLALSLANTCPFFLKDSYRNPIELQEPIN